MNMQLMMARARMNHQAPPSGGGDPYWANVISLLHFDGADGSTTFVDQTGLAWAAQGSAKLTTAAAKFGTGSGLFPNDGRILSGVNPGLAFGSGDFTIEFFVRRTSTGVIVDNRFGAYGEFIAVSIPNSLSKIAFRDTVSGTIYTSDLTAGVWYHYAVVRFSGVTVQFLNGVLQAGSYADTNNYAQQQLCVGAAYPGPGVAAFGGNIDDLRITRGVARYKGNFAVPTAAFPNHA